MQWINKGLIFGPNGRNEWARHSALQPTPLLLDDGTLRVFCGFRDDSGVSRVGCVDLDPMNPSKVLWVSDEPCLDVGRPHAFDDNGVVPCAVVERAGRIYLYYAGYQTSTKVRFTVFSGLAISDDRGRSFVRHSEVPVTDRQDGEHLFRVIHSILHIDGVWKVWYGAGDRFTQGQSKTLPVYNIRYMESENGVDFPTKGRVLLDTLGDEHRLGRPYVIHDGGTYRMFCGYGSESEPYHLTYAESPDNANWTRHDDRMNVSASKDGWDSQMRGYPSIISAAGSTYLFFNGNNYGRDGFGYAELKGELGDSNG